MLRVLLLSFLIALPNIVFALNLDIPSNISIEKNLLKKEKTKDGEIVYFDTNQDKKADLVFTYKGKDIVAEKRDRNFDGQFDVTIEIFFGKVNKDGSRLHSIEKFDNNFDGKIDLIEKTYEYRKYDKYLIHTSEDKNFDGTLEHEYTSTVPLMQDKDTVKTMSCAMAEASLGAVYQFAGSVFPILGSGAVKGALKAKLKGDYVYTDIGFKFHKNCLKKFTQPYLTTLVKEALEKGLKCFAELDKKAKKGKMNLAKENSLKIQQLLKKSPVSMVCDEKKYNWAGTLAHASISSRDNITEKGTEATHPLISVNPTFKQKELTGEKRLKFQATLFHEHLHNIGHAHGDTIESPYTCEKCCFPTSDVSDKLKSLSCKICTGQYDSITDYEYVKDMAVWGRLAYNSKRGALAVTKYLDAGKSPTLGLIQMSRATSGIFGAFGTALGQIILNKRKDKLTDHLKEQLAPSQTYAEDKYMKKYMTYAFVPAGAYYAKYDQSREQSIKVLEARIDRMIELKKKYVAGKATMDPTEKFIVEDILENTERLLSDNWLSLYNKNKKSSTPESKALEKKAWDTQKKFLDAK